MAIQKKVPLTLFGKDYQPETMGEMTITVDGSKFTVSGEIYEDYRDRFDPNGFVLTYYPPPAKPGEITNLKEG